jgi:hypothetical protein
MIAAPRRAQPEMFVTRASPSVLGGYNPEIPWSVRSSDEEGAMFLVRDIMYCKPGQARPMVKKFLALDKLGRAFGFGAMRVMTDVSAERYWTVVAEMEVESLEKYAEMTRSSMQNPDFVEVMKDYHDLVAEGRREIYQIEQ